MRCCLKIRPWISLLKDILIEMHVENSVTNSTSWQVLCHKQATVIKRWKSRNLWRGCVNQNIFYREMWKMKRKLDCFGSKPTFKLSNKHSLDRFRQIYAWITAFFTSLKYTIISLYYFTALLLWWIHVSNKRRVSEFSVQRKNCQMMMLHTVV